MDWGIREYAILYGVLVSTVALGLNIANIAKRWRDRERLECWVMASGRGTPGGALIQYIDLCIKNCSPGPIYAESWGVRRKSGRECPYFFGELPFEIEPFRTHRFKLCSWTMFLEEPTGLYVLDGRGKKWWASQDAVQKAIARAKEIEEHNREHGITQSDYARSMTDPLEES